MINSCETFLFKVTTLIAITLSVVSMFVTILAIVPFVKSEHDSIWFFVDVAEIPEDEYYLKIENQKEEEIEQDLSTQILLLSKGLKTKHVKIRYALFCNLFQMLSLLLLTFLIIF